VIAEPETMLMELAADCATDPLAFVKAFWPWETERLKSTGPRIWQAEILKHIGDHVSNPANRNEVCRVAVSSGHGIGKSAFMGMLIHWAMTTCPNSKILVTAGTGAQLATKTAPEVAKWFRSSLGADWFDVRATSIRMMDCSSPENWRTDFETWSEHNTEAFAGLHNEGRRIVLVFDEASAIADKVWEVAEGALTDEDTEIIWLAFGNPTQNTGRFRECFGRFKHRWKTFQIDSRTVEGTNKAQIEKWIADYGEDSDFVRVRVRGEFPRAGSAQFIASDVVAACRKYRAEGYQALPKIISVDVARFGDDQTVIGYRQGRKAVILGKYRGKDTVWVAEEVIRLIQQEKPDATVIDGDGLGAGTVDHIKHRGFGERLFEFHGGQPANDGSAYFNRRAEVWGSMREWLGANAEIPDEPELDSDLTGIEYGFGPKGQLQLEKKEDMKKRGLSSPDLGDMLAMTFAVNVMPKRKKPVIHDEFSGLSELETGWMA
jgi:hypothetical protein